MTIVNHRDGLVSRAAGAIDLDGSGTVSSRRRASGMRVDARADWRHRALGMTLGTALALPVQPAASQVHAPDAPVGVDMAPNQVIAPIEEGIVGRITAFDGQPVEGAVILARPLEGAAAPIPELAVSSLPDGSYQWLLGPGRYEVTVIHTDAGEARARAEVRRGEVLTLDLRLSRSGS
jgi:hypothetical protein